MSRRNKYFLNKYQILLVENDEVEHIIQIFDNTRDMAEWLNKKHHGVDTTIRKIYAGQRKGIFLNRVRCNIEFLKAPVEKDPPIAKKR